MAIKLPSKNQWRQFLKVLSKKEKKAFFLFLLMFLFGLFSFASSFYLDNTLEMASRGGSYTEGIVGSPRFINPVYASRDSDRDMTELIYSGLMKYDEKGNIVPDLAESYEVLEEGTVFEFKLREDVLWSDGENVTANDVIFTIKALQNASIKSPVRANWLGVETEKLSEYAMRFKLDNSSATFLENCTQKIIPEHIWEEISSQNFPLSIYNFKPVGSGPYKIKDLEQDSLGNIKSLELTVNAGGSVEPNIPNLKFLFFDTEEEAIEALKDGDIEGLAVSSPENYNEAKEDGLSEYSLSLPRYFSVFLNSENSEILADKEIRKALNYATDKSSLVANVLFGLGSAVDSPILPAVYGFSDVKVSYAYDKEKAKQILTDRGYSLNESGIMEKTVEKTPSFQFSRDLVLGSTGNEVSELQKCLAQDPEIYPEGTVSGYFGAKTKEAVIAFQEKYKSEILTPSGLTSGNGKVLSSTRKKLNALCAAPSTEKSTLSFTLVTGEQENLVNVALELQKQWKEIGVNLDIKTYELSSLEQDVIKPRDYEMLLFGEVLGATPDPYPFWHSSQAEDPGLNLSQYNNKNADKLLEGNRQSLDPEERKSKLEQFQEILLADAPAVFLYSPKYIYLVSENIRGINNKIIADSSKRFSGIEKWYTKTKRVWDWN
ncbi:MAG: ABC transporter substrate-binding protein [Candidatus Paceibacterota bacterium]|jgi:ABC-type transport system substrate-binding protein